MNKQLIEIASWRLASEIYRKYPDRIQIVETHPGGGQYDCLSLYDSARPGVHADLNKAGSLHIFTENDHQIHKDIWNDMLQHPTPKAVVEQVCRFLKLPPVEHVPASTSSTLVYRWIATFLTHAAFGIHSWECRSGMCDTSGYGGGLAKDFERYPTAQSRLRIKLDNNFPGDPAYRFWFLRKNGKPMSCLETTGLLWMHNSDKTYDLMDIYKKNGRQIWPTVVSVAGALMR